MRRICLIAGIMVILSAGAYANRYAVDPNSGSSFGVGVGLTLTNYASDLNMHWARTPANVTPADIGNMANIYQMLDNTVSNY